MHDFLTPILDGKPYTLRGYIKKLDEVYLEDVPGVNRLKAYREKSYDSSWIRNSRKIQEEYVKALSRVRGWASASQFEEFVDHVFLFKDQAVAIDVECPTNWRPEEYRGGSFEDFHKNAIAHGLSGANNGTLVKLCSTIPAMQRHLWTVGTREDLNWHPRFPKCPWHLTNKFWLRVETQITYAIGRNSFMFLICPINIPHTELSEYHKENLLKTMRDSLGTQAGEYKKFPVSYLHVERMLNV